MMFKLQINTNNDAFQGDTRAELASILRVLAERIDQGRPIEQSLFDVNGNKVGKAWVEEDETEDPDWYEEEFGD